MTNTATPRETRDRQNPPKQSKEGEIEIESRPIPPRKEEDQFYWCVNDVIVKARALGGGYFPEPYLEWEEHHPNGPLKQWIESEVEKDAVLILDVEEILRNLSAYLHSTKPDTILESVTSPQHCYDKILEGPDLLKRRSAPSLSRALREELLVQRRLHLGQSGERHAEAADAVKAQKKVDSKTAAAFLAPFLRDRTCSISYIGTLARKGSITRDETTGMILSSSLIAYRDGRS